MQEISADKNTEAPELEKIRIRLIHRSAVREKVFSILEERRPHLAKKMTRVSEQFFFEAESAVIRFIEDRVSFMPTVGRTIR